MKLTDIKQQPLTEASLSRVYRHVQNLSDWAVISAFRGELQYEENMERHRNLKQEVRSLGYGFNELDGVWKNDDGEFEEERSLFIAEITRNEAFSLLRQFDQDAVVVPSQEHHGEAELLFPDGSSEHLGPFRANIIADVYSRLRGAPGSFTFQ